MGELSDRFAALMARMAKSDADLFRTLTEQGVSVRQLVDELAGPTASAEAQAAPVLAAAGLLPEMECTLKALKARFGKVAEAQAWVEQQIGQAPKKPTWAVIEQACRSGSWPVSSIQRSTKPPVLTSEQLQQRLLELEHRLDERFDRLERLLAVVAQSLDTTHADRR